MLVVVLVLENPDRFAIRLTEQNSCRTSVYLRSRNPNAPRTSTTTRTSTIPNFGIWVKPSQAGEIPELLTSSSGDLNFRTGMQLYPQPATEPGSNALDPAKIDDLPPVSSEKDPGIQSNLKRVQRTRHESTLAFKIDSRVISLRLEQRDFCQLHHPAVLSVRTNT